MSGGLGFLLFLLFAGLMSMIVTNALGMFSYPAVKLIGYDGQKAKFCAQT
jgi:hypothetical protein